MITLVLITAILSVYILLKWKHGYWSRKGITQLKPSFLLGDFGKAVCGRTTNCQIISNAYNAFKKAGVKHGGIYFLYTPLWIPVDRDLIKKILFQDFSHFTSHGNFFTHKNDILSNHLFNSEGEEWKRLRTKLTPTFSTGKLKIMFGILDEIGDRLTKRVEELHQKKEPIEIKEVAACFGTDVIASCAFGIECNTLENPNNDFRKYGKSVFERHYVWEVMELFFNWNFLGFFGYKFLKRDINNFFLNLVIHMVEYREKNNIIRKDFLHLLLQLKNKGHLTDEDDISKNSNIEEALSFEDLVANVFLIYAAGFETTATTMSFLMYELAKNPDIQEKARKEILDICKNRPNNKFTYEDLRLMKYCEMMIQETLRLHTVAPEIPRKCTKDYNIPGTDVVIKKGTIVLIPGWALHRDPEYYPNPEQFNPENFNEKNKLARSESVFFAFGQGPRLCLGYRFAITQLKVALAKYLMKYRYTLNPKTSKIIEYEVNMVTMVPKGNVLLNIEAIQ